MNFVAVCVAFCLTSEQVAKSLILNSGLLSSSGLPLQMTYSYQVSFDYFTFLSFNLEASFALTKDNMYFPPPLHLF